MKDEIRYINDIFTKRPQNFCIQFRASKFPTNTDQPDKKSRLDSIFYKGQHKIQGLISIFLKQFIDVVTNC